jgi:hypothetical protein
MPIMDRRTFLTQCALGSVGLAAFLPGCQPATQTGSALVADTENKAVAPAGRPAIDLATPSIFETATFALG